MRIKFADFSRIVLDDIVPFSKTISNRTRKPKSAKSKVSLSAVDKIAHPPETPKRNAENPPSDQLPDYRENEMQIQMLSKSLFEQIFGREEASKLDANNVKGFKDQLQQHGINPGESFRMPDITSLRLPRLLGANIEEHFLHIARNQSEPYQKLISQLVGLEPPEMPAQWQLASGWTHYCSKTKTTRSVPFPEDRAIVFDIENCVKEGAAPTMACALGRSGWYSWVSPALIDCASRNNRPYQLSDLIPLEADGSVVDRSEPRIVVGHNVSYDRARVREQYLLQDSGVRFMDTMSMHVCVSGVTSYQRAILKAKREVSAADQVWSQHSSLNSLLEVHRLYCPDAGDLDKDKRDTFVVGQLVDIRADFQNLMVYCARDVLATHRVLGVLYPRFCERFPHPATLAGMLEIGMAYLPVRGSWRRYIQAAHLSYDDLTIESNRILEQRANWTCRLANAEQWRKDIWMWDQDWSKQELKLKKATKKSKQPTVPLGDDFTESDSEENLLAKLTAKFQTLMDKKKSLPARRPLLPGYPEWYRKLCEKNRGDGRWQPGPINIGTGMQITPKLLSLCWEGYPLHYIKGKGWGFLLPFNGAAAVLNQETDGKMMDGEQVPPLKQLIAKCPVLEPGDGGATSNETDDAFRELVQQVEMNLGKRDFYRRKPKSAGDTESTPPNAVGYTGTGVWTDEQLGDNIWFLKLPHKDGVNSRVGNPMAKDFLSKFAENVLSGEGLAAERVIRIAGQCSYWRNNRERIEGQMVVWLDEAQERGAILPQVVVCGTLTRRAMEATWMTASNAQRERVGSELRGMITAPDGYRFVGADVDSQELWIAAVLGDAAETGCHGATAFGWMTLNGSKANGTDMHSVTAKAVGISRDQAKVINYARIYGAGQQFAERLLKQFNPTLCEGEARSKAQKMFALTKGKRLFELRPEFHEQFLNKRYTRYEASRLCAAVGQELGTVFERPKWFGGTESAMFNRLEEIAEMGEPVTPFLQCRLSRPLEPQPDGEPDRFLPTRVNWVVQSGAVDFLHLMLVCMRWLMGAQNIRFSLSFHDEIRYLVRDDLADQAAVAMHVTNLLTRAFCAHRLGLNDLPQSVAFFQSVEIDRVLRKESQADYQTPSNPHGLAAGYGIAAGESLTIEAALDRIAGKEDMSKWPWHASENDSKM